MEAHIHILVWDVDKDGKSVARCKYCGETAFVKKDKDGKIVYELVGKEEQNG